MGNWTAVTFCCFLPLSVLLLIIQGQVPPGGHHPISPDDPNLQPAVEYAAASLNAECGCRLCQTVVDVQNATMQVVDGTQYQFSLQVQESDQCLSEECMGSLPDDRCPPDPKAKPYWCFMDVVIRGWATPTHFVLNMTCDKPPKGVTSSPLSS